MYEGRCLRYNHGIKQFIETKMPPQNSEKNINKETKSVDAMLNDGKFLEFLSRVQETGREFEVTDENTAEVQEMYHLYTESKKAAQLFAEVAHSDFKQTLGAEVST